MSPLRIIILAILFYIGYRLIVSSWKSDSDGSSKPNSTDTLEEDPVCKKLVPRLQAVQLKKDGKTHYFCSKECRKAFKKNKGDL